MGAFDEFLVSPPTPGPGDMGGINDKVQAGYTPPATIDMSVPVEPTNRTEDQAWSEFITKPASPEVAMSANLTFDYDKSNAERYVQDRHYKELGFNPFEAPVMRNGRAEDANELRYKQAQSIGDVAWKGVVGGSALMWDTAYRQFAQWGDTVKGLTDLMSGQGWEKAKRDFVGTDADLLQANKEQQDIMNKYAIFHSNDEGIFSKEYLFDNIQQFGLGAGQGLEMLAEVAATWGIGAAFKAMRAPAALAKLAGAAEAATDAERFIPGAVKTGEEAERAAMLRRANGVFTDGERISAAQRQQMAVELQRGSDMSLNKPFVDALWETMSKAGHLPIPGSGIVSGIGDIGQAYRAGATGWGAWKGGVGSMAKELSLFNMSVTHGKLLAFTTYGQQYADLINQYEVEHNGQEPMGEDLERIKNNAWMAAGDNFTLNVGLIMAMGKIEWGGLYSKLGSSTRILREAESSALEGAESNITRVKGNWVKGATRGADVDAAEFAKTGNIAAKDLGAVADEEVGTAGQKAYEKQTKMFPAIRTLNMVRKDFGLGTALWEATKVMSKSQLAKFQIAEGLHMVLQNTSDIAFRKYYKNQYNGGTDINGHSFLDAAEGINWTDEMKKEFANTDPGGGFKTFIMGATNGMFMTPIHHIGNWANTRIMTKINPDAKNAMEYRQAAIDENIKMMNTWYKDPNNVFNAHIDGIKTAGKASQGMSDGVEQQSKYVFHNSKNDLFAKTVSTFIKTGNFDSFLYTLKNMGNMDAKSFYEAFPGMKPSDPNTPLREPRQVIDEVAKDVTDYYTRFQTMKDKFSGYVRPEYFEGRGSEQLKASDKRRAESHQKLTDEYADTKWNEEHDTLPDDEKTANKVKQDEYLNKANRVEEDYLRETSKNRYAQELMRKRVLDESIELMATTDYQAHAAVKRMADVVSQMSDVDKYPGVSSHASQLVNVLGDKAATRAEIYRLNELIKISEGVISAGTNEASVAKDVKEQIKAQKEQVKHLLAWQLNLEHHQSHDMLEEKEKATLAEGGAALPDRATVVDNLQAAYQGYINSLNEGIATTPVQIDQPQFNDTLELLYQHMNLAKDFGNYKQALDVLSNPKGFNLLYKKIYDAMRRNTFDMYINQRRALEGYTLHKQVIEQLKKVADEQAKAREEEEKTKLREAASKQAGKLSEHLANIQNDIKALNDEKAEVEKHIKAGEARAGELRGDLQAARDLLADEGKTKSDIQKEFKRMEQSLRGKIKYLEYNMRPLVERRDAIEKALDTFTKMKDHYSRALNELESYNKPFEEINPIQSDDLQKVKDLQYTDKNIDGIVEDTKKELEMLNERIDYFQSVVDTTQKAIQDLIDFVFFTDKGGSLQEKFLEKHRQQAKVLKTKFDNYSRDLADAKLKRDRVLQKYGRLSITQLSREALKGMEEELHYVKFIQKSLEEQHWEPRPQLQEEEGPQGETAEYFADQPLASGIHDDTVHEAPEKTEEQIKAETEKKEAITENLLDHFTTPSTEMTAEAKAEFDQFPSDAREQLEAITDSIGAIPEVADDSVQVLRDKAEEIIKKAQDEALSLVSYPQYTDVPYIEKGTNGMWRVMNPNNTYTGQQFGLKADANKVVTDRVLQLHPDAKEQSPARKAIYEERNAELRKVNDNYKASWKTDNPVPRLSHIHEVNRIEREADRKVLDLTDLSSQEKEIKAIDLFKRRLIDSIEDVTAKDVADAPKKYRIGKYESSNSFSTKQEALDSIDKYVDVLKQDVQKKYTPADERNFEEEQNVQDELFKDSPMLPNDKQSRNDRINYNDINSVSPLYDSDTKSYKKAELKELFSKYTPEEIRDNMTVDVLANTKAGELSYPIKNNDSVRRRAPKYVYRVSVNGDQAFFLQPNGASYEFDISGRDESQRWITTDSPEFYDDNVFGTNEFARFFNYPPGANVGVTLAKFKADVKKATMLGQVLSTGKITNDQLREKLTFDVRKGLNYSNENPLKGTVKLPSSFADVEASGMEFAGVVIDNGILPNSGKGSRYAGGFGSPAEEAELAGLSPVPTENKGQYTAAFRMTDGTVRWVELSPTTLGETEMNSRIAQVAQILSNVNSNEEIGSTDLNNINKILESVFIATNPYAEGADYFSQKVKLSGRIGIDNNGEAKMTIFLKDTYNMPSAKETAVVGLGKFSEIKDANALLEKINYNLANYGLNHDNAPFVRNIVSHKPLDMSRFKEQVDNRDIANIKKMDTNVHVDKINNTVVPNSGLTVVPSWSFNVPAEPTAIPLIPAKKVKNYSKVEPDANKEDANYNVNRLNDLKRQILETANLSEITDDIFRTLDEKEYEAWQKTLDMTKVANDIQELLKGVSNDVDAHNIVTKYILPKFIDKKLAEQKNQMENGPERETPETLAKELKSLQEFVSTSDYSNEYEKGRIKEIKKELDNVKNEPAPRTIDVVSKELEEAIGKGDNAKIASLSWELQNTVPTTTPLSEVMEEATDNPTADTITASKAPTAAERKAAREREQAALQAKMKEQQDRSKAPKYLSPSDNFNQVSAENIEKFQVWCAKNLPQDLLSVKDLGVLTDNMRNSRVTVGQFVTYMEGINVKGRIETYQNAPFKYHEAFHGVFRLLLDQKRIDTLMREAERDAPISQEDFDAFRAKGYDYKGREMIERFLEERMADKFDAWKAGRKEPNTLIGKFFRWVSDLWNSLRAKLSGSQLQGLFYEIERGKYRNSKLQDNQFTEGGFVSESMPVSKVIELGVQELPNGQIVTRSLAQNVADRYSATIAGQVILDLQKGRGDETTILDRILDNYRDTLDPFANEDFYKEIVDKNFSDSPEGRSDRAKWFSQLDDHFQTFGDETARQQMKESVAAQLRNYGLRVNTETDAVEEFMEKTSNTPDNFDRDSFSLGGFGNLNSQVRQFIGSATYQLDHDEFFNTTFKDGTPITQAVHVGKVYNGLLRALGNQADPASALQNLVSFALDTSNSNPETTHFAKYLFEKAGFNYEAFTAGAEVNDCFDGDTGNPTLLNSMIQGFNQQGLNYLFQGFDSNMDVRNSYANTKDSSYYQVKIWGEHFNNIMGRGITDDNSQPMVDLHNLFSINKMSTAVITKGQKVGEIYVKGTFELSKDIKRLTGIELHPDFLLYSILKNKEARNPDVLDKEQVKFIAAHPVSDVIEPTVLQDIINQLRGPKKDIFSKQGLEGDERSFSESYLNKWATGNANFDEKVNSMNFKSADNKSRYAYIQQNTVGQLVVGMNDPNWQANINDPEFLTDIGGNYLLTNKQYDRLLQQRKLKLLSADGAREMDTLGGDGERDKEKRNSDGVTFGSMNDRELKFYMLGLYNIVGQPDCTIYRGRQEDFYVAPVPIRVNAEKKSLFSVRLPIIDAVTTVRGKSGDFNISNHAMPILYSIVEREVNRIKTVHDQLEALGPDGQVQGHERIEGWNTGDRAKMRGLQLYVAKEWFSDELRKEIEAEAKKETPDLKPFKDQIEKEINEHFRDQVKNFAKEMEKDGMIELDEDGQYQNVIAPDYLFSGYGEYKTETVDKDGVSTAVTSFVPNKITDKVYIKNGKFMSNLGQVLMNHFINCTEFNNLLHGDESKMFKNNTDPTKRESSNVGTYNNLRTMFKDESLGIDHSIEVIHGICLGDSESPKQFSGPNGGNVKTDDGMMWMTNKGLRYTLFGTCKLDAFKARLLDNLMSGKLVSETEFFGGRDKGEVIKGLEERGAFNSMKLLFADGRVTLKCSAFTLTPELTSVFNETTGDWDIPMVHRKEAHELRVKIEQFENSNNTIVYAYPKSVSKTLTRNVAETVGDITDSHFEPLDPKFMGNQLENPSNKLSGIEKSQPDWLITSGHADPTLSITTPTGKTASVQSVIDVFHDAKFNKLKNDWEGAINTLFTAKDGSRIKLGDHIDVSKMDVNIGSFLDHIRENLEMEGTDAQLLGFMETKDGVPVYNINYPGILPKVTANFFTMLSKGVLQGRVPELSLALVSGARGIGSKIKEVKSVWTQKDIDKYSKQGHTKVTQDLLGQPKTWEVITDEQYRYSPDRFKNAKSWTDKAKRTYSNLRVGDFIIDDLRHNFPEFHEVKGKEEIKHYTSEYMRPAHYAEEMHSVQKSLEYSFAVRIPADAKHSFINAKLVDTLPVQLGSVGIFPQELLEIAGPDFDIDKQYVQIADTYKHQRGGVNNRKAVTERVAYGTADTPEGKFHEYVEYMAQTNRAVKDALSTVKTDSLEGKVSDILGADMTLKTAALKAANLPSTMEEFQKAGGDKLNNGVQNNRMLDAKMGLLGNREAVKQQDTPTSTDPIKKIISNKEEGQKGFVQMFAPVDGKFNSEYEEFIYNKLTEKNTDINSIPGMVNDRLASKVGVEAIGAVANANKVYALGHEKKLALRNDDFAITIDGVTYNSFEHSTAIGHPDERIDNSVSSMLNLFADQPKDRDASKLGLDTKSAGFATYEMTHGMTKETALLYMLQPAAVDYIRKIDKLDGELKTKEELDMFKSVQLKTMMKELTDEGAKVIENFKSADLIRNIKEGGTDKDVQLTVLDHIRKMETKAVTFFKVNRILNLIQGHDATIEGFYKVVKDMRELGIVINPTGTIRAMNESEWKELIEGPDAPVVDMRDILMDKKHFISHYIQTVGQLDKLLPAVFLEATPLFRGMMSAVESNLRVPFGADGETFSRKAKYDLIGYMALRAYMNQLQTKVEAKRGTPADIATMADLTNNLIYANNNENRSIIDIVENLKQKVQDAGIRNQFLDFLYSNANHEKTNGLNRVDTNTWTTLSEQQQQQLIESFVDLYANNYRASDGTVLDTHQAAQSMFNYLLVKDGGQFVNGTFIKFMPPFIFKDFMDVIGNVNDLLSGKSENYDLFGKGVTATALLQDFLKGYATHNANEYQIRRIREDSNSVFPEGVSTQMSNYAKDLAKLTDAQREVVEGYEGYNKTVTPIDNGIKINMFNGIREVGAAGGKYNAVEKLMRDQNWFYLNRLGFQFAEGKTLQFPYSIRYGKDGQLYTLVNVERRVEGQEHKMGKVSVDQMISEGEFIPSGVIATYTMDNLRGSKQQFAAGFVLPNLPLSKDLVGMSTEDKATTNKNAAEQRLADFDEKYVSVMNSEGKVGVYERNNPDNPVGVYTNKFEAIKALARVEYSAVHNALRIVPNFQLSSEQGMPDLALSKQLSHFVSALKGEIRNVGEIVINGVKYDANAVTDILNRVISVVDGKEKLDTLPEETGHLFVEYLPQSSALLKEMMKDIVTRPIFDKTLNEYKDNKFYQNEDGSVNEDKIAREAAGKMIAQAITDKWKNQREKSVWQKLWGRLWNWIKKLAGKVKETPYEQAAGDILKGKTGKLDLAKIAEAEKEGRYYFQMSKEQQENEDYIQQVRDNPNTTDEQRTRIDQIILDPKNKIVLDPDTHEYTDLNINNPTKYTPGTKAIGGTKFLTDKDSGEPAYEMNRKWGNYFDGILRGVLLNKAIDEVESPIVYENNSQLQADFDSKFKQKAFDIARNIYQNEMADGSIVLSQSILSYKAPRAIDSIASSSDILVVSPSGKVSNIDLKTSWKSINAVNGHGNKIYEVEHKIERDMKNPENNSWLLRLPGGGYDTGLRLSKKDTHILQLMLHQELLRKMGVKNFGNFRNYYIHLITDDNTNALNPTLLDAVAEGFSQNQLEDLPRVYEDLMERLLPEEQSSDPLSAADPQPTDNLNPNPDELAKPLMKIIENLEKRKDSLLRGVKPETANELKQTLSEVKILEDKYKVEALMRFVKYAQEFTNKGLTLTSLDYNKLTGDNRRNYFKWLIEARDIAKANLDLIPESIEVMQGVSKMQVPMLSLLNNEQRGTFNKLRADMNSLRIQSDLAMVNYVVQTGVNEFDITPAPGQSAAKAAEEFLFRATQDISLFMKETDAPGEMRDTLLGKINNIIRKADISVSMEAEKIRNNIEQMAKDYGLDLSKKENSDFMFDLDKDGKRTRLKQKTSLDFLEEKRAIDESIMNPDGTRKEFVENPQDQKDKDYNIQLAKDKEKYREFYDPEMRINAGDQREGTHYHLTKEYADARNAVMRYLPDYDTWVKKTSVSQEEYEAFRNHYQVRNLDFLTPDRDKNGDYTGTVSRNNSWSVNRQYVEVNDNKYSYRENPNAPSGWEQVVEKSLENPEYKKLMATDTKQRKLFVAYKGMLEKAIAEGGPELEEWYARGGLVALTGKMFDKGMKTGAMKLLKESVSIGTIPQISDRETTETGQLRHTLHVPFISKLKNAQRIKAIEHSLSTLEDDFNRGELRDDTGKRITGQVEKNTYKKSLEDKLKIENARTDAGDLEVDPLRGLTAFLEGVNTYKHMADIEGQLLAMQQLVNQEISLDPTDKRTVRQYYGDEREFQRRGMDTAFKEKNDIRSIEVLNNIIKNFYGEGVEKKVIDQIAKKFMTWTSASAMGLNIPNNLNNFILYSFNAMRQGVAGRFMSFKNMRKGFAEVEKNYFAGIAKKAFMRKGENNLGYKDKAESKVEAMMKRFNINAEDYFKMQGADAWISKFYIGEKLAVQHAEFGMATGYMMDQLLRDKDGNEIKITKDGKETPVSMWDAYKYNNNTGELELIDQLKGREAEYDREEKNIIIRAKDIQIKTQGNYDARSKTLMDNHLLGRLLMQFHRFWKPAWNDRFAKQYTHASLGEMEGTWTSMYSAIKMMKEFDDHWTTQLQGGWKGFADRAKAAGYSDERIDLMKKNLITDLVEVLTVSSLFAMSYVIGKAAISYHKKHPDMDKNTIRFINYWRYTTSRLASEEMTFTPGVNLILLTELVNNPLAVSRTLKNFGQAIRLSVQYPINAALGDSKANYYQKGIYKGDSKAYIRLRKSIPFWQVYDKWLLFSEMSDYNNVLAGATGGKAGD